MNRLRSALWPPLFNAPADPWMVARLAADPLPYAAAGATWWLPEFVPGVRLDTVRGVLRGGPASPGGG